MFNRWFVVLGSILVQISLGAVYAWSLFNQPLADCCNSMFICDDHVKACYNSEKV